jgi:hypothetical protein
VITIVNIELKICWESHDHIVLSFWHILWFCEFLGEKIGGGKKKVFFFSVKLYILNPNLPPLQNQNIEIYIYVTFILILVYCIENSFRIPLIIVNFFGQISLFCGFFNFFWEELREILLLLLLLLLFVNFILQQK